MRPVIALIFHSAPPPGAGPLVRALAETRRLLAAAQVEAFLDAGADDARLIEGEPDWLPFGRRLAAAVRYFEPRGAIVLGSGSIPLARAADYARLVEVAAGPAGLALANNRFSADVVAVSHAADLTDLPDLPADNALPRWLEERAGVRVSDMARRWRLSIDLDSPADFVLLGLAKALPTSLGVASTSIERLAPNLPRRAGEVSGVLADRRAELLIAGRVSAATLLALQAETSCRIRALVEERGLRASSPLAQARDVAAGSPRPPRSILGDRLDRDGPESVAAVAAELGDGAVIDTRVLLAHRLGVDESAWPGPEDRFASDLLAPDLVADPWLRSLTAAAAGAPVPILLGGHSLLNGDLRLLAASRRPGGASGRRRRDASHAGARAELAATFTAEPADTPA